MTPTRIAAVFAFALACAALPAGAQVNGGFENGNLGSWTDNSGGSATVTNVAENGFPTQGDFFLSLSAGTSNDATAAHGPHPGGGGIGNTAQVSRTFTRPAGNNFELLIDWTFLNEEGADDSQYNDFLSIDLIDVASGTLIQNVVFCDTGFLAGTPAYTNVPGAAGGDLAQTFTGSATEVLPNGMKRAYADLSFSTTPGQNLRLDISVGNESDSAVDSIALIDNLVLRAGAANFEGPAAMRILSTQHDDVAGSSSDFIELGTYQMRVKPGQSLAFRTNTSVNGQAMALLAGQEARNGPDFGFGQFNLQIPTLTLIFDGINPSNAADALLGTLNNGSNFIAAQVPDDATDGQIAFQGILADAFNPFGFSLTAATNVIVDTTTRIPEGATQAMTSGGFNLGLDDTATVDISSMNGGGFTFYGVLYTEAFMNSHGYVTFGGIQNDFTETVGEFFTQQPKVAACWTDLNPAGIAGAATFDVAFNVARFTWNVEDTTSGGDVAANHFTIELWATGEITISYESLNVSDALAGISPGGLAAPVAPNVGVNWSGQSFGNRVVGTATDPLYQIFDFGFPSGGTTDSNDIMTLLGGARLTFAPNASGGYDAYAGTR